LESAVDRLLKAAELREQDITKAEELQMQHLTEEEIATRRAELRKMRDLMFRVEIKAKRISKIKSKTYRKIQKKERTKQAEKLKEMGLGVDDETERMKMEIDRAKERATLKHKNNGKWAASMRARGELDEDQRKDMQEMYERGERLKKKIAGVDSEGDESDDDDDDARLGELAALAKEDLQPVSLSGRQGGLMEMKFMRDAERRDQASNRDVVDSFNDELSKLGIRQASDEDEISQGRDQMIAISRVGGRVSFNPGETV
jgi:U3 small nucleolar RNA-associated protein 14